MPDSKKGEHVRYRIFEILEVRTGSNPAARVYDCVYLFTIVINLTVSIMHTYESYRLKYGDFLLLIENITVALFCIDYVLRLSAAKYMYPESGGPGAVRKYVFSFTGIIDMLSFLPLLPPDLFSIGGRSIPTAESHADIPAVPHQCLLQLVQTHNRSIEQQTAATLFFRIHNPHSHARLQSVHVQPGTRGSAGSIHQCVLRNLVGGVHAADSGIR